MVCCFLSFHATGWSSSSSLLVRVFPTSPVYGLMVVVIILGVCLSRLSRITGVCLFWPRLFMV